MSDDGTKIYFLTQMQLSSATGVAQTSASAVLSISSAAATAKTTPGTSPTTYTTSGAAPVQTSIPGKSDAAPSRVLEQLVCFGVAIGIGAFLI
jgi:hypothetical protein